MERDPEQEPPTPSLGRVNLDPMSVPIYDVVVGDANDFVVRRFGRIESQTEAYICVGRHNGPRKHFVLLCGGVVNVALPGLLGSVIDTLLANFCAQQ